MRILLACLLLLPFMNCMAESQIEPLKAVQSNGSITIFDKESFYTFNSNGTFDSGPRGMSGTTITGTWHTAPGSKYMFIVQGLWGAINGLSKGDEYREVTFVVGAGHFISAKEVGRPVTGPEALAFHDGIFQCQFALEQEHPLKPSPASPAYTDPSGIGIPPMSLGDKMYHGADLPSIP